MMDSVNQSGGKFDIKTVVIVLLLLSSTVFGFMWFFSGNEVSKDRVKQLEADFKKLESEKAAADAKITEWKGKYVEADKMDKVLSGQISGLKKDSRISEEKARKSKEDLDNVQNGISENRKEIENLKKNPPKLSDDELMEALIKKIN
jgi:chromosome segregation ATPase